MAHRNAAARSNWLPGVKGEEEAEEEADAEAEVKSSNSAYANLSPLGQAQLALARPSGTLELRAGGLAALEAVDTDYSLPPFRSFCLLCRLILS